MNLQSTASSTCPVCNATDNPRLRDVDGVAYFDCASCGSLFADRVLINRIDAGQASRVYDDRYWERELADARQRSFGSSLARVAEVLLYARTPVTHFVDVGTGPGFLLDALSYYLPSSQERFCGVELFPPDERHRSKHPNYRVGPLRDVDFRFQAGCCIEVIEHLTPKMLRALAEDLAAVSDPQAIYIFNSGNPAYVKWEDPGYLDPHGRGHIMSYSHQALSSIFGPCGFTVFPLVGKTWAFVAEYASSASPGMDLAERIWSPVPGNAALLDDPRTGELMRILGIESARAYRQYDPRLVSAYKHLRDLLRWLRRAIRLG